MILCVGPPKAGTTTMWRALCSAGLNAVHTSVGPMPAAIALQRAFMEDRDPFYYVPSDVDAITDPYVTGAEKLGGASAWPTFCPGFLRDVRGTGARVILHTRRTEDWVHSVSRWKDLRARIVAADLPFLPPGAGATDEELGDWIEGHYARTREAMLAYGRFLEIAIEDPVAPGKIDELVGCPVRWWGVENANGGRGA